MDQKEEFQFRPLTQGLGFHKKSGGKVEGGDKSKNTSTSSAQVSRLISAIPSLDMFDDSKTSKPTLRQPLPRADLPKATPMVNLPKAGGAPAKNQMGPGQMAGPLTSKNPQEVNARKNVASLVGQAAKSAMGFSGTDTVTKTSGATSSITKGPIYPTGPAKPAGGSLPEIQLPANKSPFAKPGLEITESQATELPVQPELVEVPLSLGAVAFDTLLVVGIASLFAVALLLITESDLALVLMNAQEDGATQLGIFLVLLTVYQLYMVVTRSFFGSTLGEWAFDVTVGNPTQQEKAMYPFRVAWRAIVVAASGFVLLPLLSLALKRDVAGLASGIKTFKSRSY